MKSLTDKHRCKRFSGSQPPRTAVILIIVLVVIAVLALAGYTFSELMLRHKESVLLHGRQIQSQALVDSGVEVVKQFLAKDKATQDEAGGLFNNSFQFQGITVVDDVDLNGRGKFTVISPSLDDEGNSIGMRYGLDDESTRLNLNALSVFEKTIPDSGKSILMALPGMTEDVAAAILDWLDEDEEPRASGAEVEYYGTLKPPYRPKNGPLETVEELLLVRGVTPQLLFGADVNRNGYIDQNELNSQRTGAFGLPTTTNSTGSADRGWSVYLTLFSQERNLNSQGKQRIFVNDADLKNLNTKLREVFNEEWSNFIIAYRQNGPQQVQGQLQSAGSAAIDLEQPGNTMLTQVLDLIGVQTRAKFKGQQQPVSLTCPFPNEPLQMATYMTLLMDNLAVSQTASIPGRININQAPRVILAGIPGMNEQIVEKVISQRQAAMDDEEIAKSHQQETWIMSEGIVTLSEMKSLLPFVTGAGHVYRAQIVGYFQAGGGASRVEVVFDSTKQQTSLLSWRDISHLGRGYALETLGMDLQAGF